MFKTINTYCQNIFRAYSSWRQAGCTTCHRPISLATTFFLNGRCFACYSAIRDLKLPFTILDRDPSGPPINGQLDAAKTICSIGHDLGYKKLAKVIIAKDKEQDRWPANVNRYRGYGEDQDHRPIYSRLFEELKGQLFSCPNPNAVSALIYLYRYSCFWHVAHARIKATLEESLSKVPTVQLQEIIATPGHNYREQCGFDWENDNMCYREMQDDVTDIVQCATAELGRRTSKDTKKC
jgi:hypothetical protein